MGGQHVVISLVLRMIMEIHVFPQVLFQFIPLTISMEQSCALVDPKSVKQGKSMCESDNCCFLFF